MKVPPDKLCVQIKWKGLTIRIIVAWPEEKQWKVRNSARLSFLKIYRNEKICRVSKTSINQCGQKFSLWVGFIVNLSVKNGVVVGVLISHPPGYLKPSKLK